MGNSAVARWRLGFSRRPLASPARHDVSLPCALDAPCRRNRMRSFKVTAFSAPLAEVEAPTPEPSGTEVLLKVRAAGVCHSDLHIWEGGYDLGHGHRLSLKERGIPLPLTMGHETVGEIVGFGPDASGVKSGEVRLIYPWIGCGHCPV